MRGLLTLVRKEWRDVRAVTAASAVLVVAACLAVRWFLEERFGGAYADFLIMPRHLEAFVPACAALYATLIAADIVGGEVATRRIDLVELLPAGRGRVWAAKAMFLIAASSAFTVWCALVQWGVLAAVDGARFSDMFAERTLSNLWTVGLVATFAGSTLVVSTVGLRGLGAALVGGAAALGLFVGACQFARFLGYGGDGVQWLRANEQETIAALWLPPAVLATAALAYRFGRVHLGRVVRPVSIALGVLVAALAGPGAALAYDALTVVPGRSGAHFRDAWPSPDGRFVALPFQKFRPSQVSKVFVLDTERGVLVEPETGHSFVEVDFLTRGGVWEADGSLQVVSYSDEGVDLCGIDPASGAIRRRKRLDLAAYRERARLRQHPWREAFRWTDVQNRRMDDGLPTFLVTATDALGADRREVRSWAAARVLHPSGLLVYFPEPCVLAVRTLPDGEERRLLTNREPWRGGAHEIGTLSQDGRAMLVRHDGVWKSLDLATGGTTELPPCDEQPHWWWVGGDTARRIVVLRPRRNASTAEIVDLVTGARAEVAGHDWGSPHALSDGRFVVVRSGPTLELWDRDLKFVRRLWPTGKE